MSYTDLLISARKYSSFLLIFLTLSCRKSDTLFQPVSSSHSKIHFNNQIIENDSVNQLDIENVYNGGGVGIGDFNNDGRPDIFFTGNLVSCKLYLNNGNFTFRDVTDVSDVSGEGKWCRGVAVIDINNDGWQDIYVSATLKKKPDDRKNLLYINQGLDKNNTPIFKEEAREYGLDDNSHTTQANFIDYDNDGDIDVYLVVNEINKRISPYLFHPVLKNGSNPSTGKLFRNDWSDSLKHPVFTDVSKEAGIQTEGYGHSAIITDINNDGWKDIFIGNDFLTSDLLWINNRNGTFTDELSSYFKHTSANSMGNDIRDINNDGLMDIVSLDMNPEDNYRKKMMLPSNNYQTYQNTERYGYSYQYVRNTLQLNQGSAIGQNDSVGLPVFSEIGYYAGITATDWSWTPLLSDFDNDGYPDLIICNGFPKDITDHDFAMFRNRAFLVASKDQILTQVPVVKLHNYAFRNSADLTFTDVSDKWGMTAATFSNGAAYADLDNDGDLDLIINNINDEASLYRNNLRELNNEKTHFIHVRLKGPPGNKQGLGAWIEIYYDSGKKQVWENNPFRGYLSTMEEAGSFGLGTVKSVDSVVVRWQNGKIQKLINVKADQSVTLDIANAGSELSSGRKTKRTNPLFTEITRSLNVNFVQKETDFVDFNIQKLIPHKFSEYGPAISVGDIDGNGLDDIICGGSSNNSAAMFLQQPDGRFSQRNLLPDNQLAGKSWDDTGILLFDADHDGSPDLYIASGGYEADSNSSSYRDHFYVNDGKGNFKENSEAIPLNYTSKFCVRSADFDKDGDLDLFIAGRVDPWNYPKPVSSFILRNDSKPGHIKFTDVTNEVANGLSDVGLVCDALFTDFDNDGWIDLILAGEWMPVTFFKNVSGHFTNVTSSTGIRSETGWWNSISSGDFDNDGDIDYVIGNLGLNSFYKASEKYPVAIYASDFDNNGSFDAFPSIWLHTSQADTSMKEYPVHSRDDAVKQMIGMRSRFQNYKSFALATIDQLFSKEQLKKALILKASNLRTSYCRNDGNGRFTLIPLPMQAQISVINGMTVDDYDGDGNLDIIMSGNDWGTEVSVGRYDALNGLLLRGNGKGGFTSLSIQESGIYIPGNGKGLAFMKGKNDRYLIAAAQNRGPLKIFELKRKTGIVSLLSDEVGGEAEYKNGTSRKLEFYWGSSFLSQSGRFMMTDKNMKRVVISNTSGDKRKIEF
jgi:hypothetical protein